MSTIAANIVRLWSSDGGSLPARRVQGRWSAVICCRRPIS